MKSLLVFAFFLCMVHGGPQKITSRSIYGSARYETVYNLIGGRVGQVVSKPVYLAGNATMTCIYTDPLIPADTTTYPTADFGLFNTTSSKFNALGITVNVTTGIDGAAIFCVTTALTTSGNYVAIRRKTTYLAIAGTNDTQDACGVWGGDNTTCCYNTSCNGRGTCDSSSGICDCDVGWVGDYCESANVDCVNGTFNDDTGFCDCDDGFTGPSCDIPNCSDHGYWSDTSSSCVCKEGWAGTNCDTCNPSPSPTSDRTYVCHETDISDRPYGLVAIKTRSLEVLKGHYVMPNSVDRFGTIVDCSCDVTNATISTLKKESHSHSHHKKAALVSKLQRQISKLDQQQSYPEFVNQLLEELGDLSGYSDASIAGSIIDIIQSKGLVRSSAGTFLTMMIGVAGAFFGIMFTAAIYSLSKQIKWDLKKK